jgi:hypothetical protein
MRFDSVALADAQRRAYDRLIADYIIEPEKTIGADGGSLPVDVKKVNQHYVPPKLTTSPAMIIQELPWVNTVTEFTFDFSQNAPVQIPGTNNNVNLSKNDVFAIYGVQILFATGTNSASFIYRSHGVLPADDALYNSVITSKIESSVYVDKMAGQFFRDNPVNSNEFYGEIGMQLINPIRVVSGELGVFNFKVNLLNPIAALVISANTLISFRLHGVYGQAKG